MEVKSESEVSQSCPTQRPHVLQPTRLLRPGDFPSRSTGVAKHSSIKMSYYKKKQKNKKIKCLTMDMSTVEQIWLYIALALNFCSACYLQLP